MIARRCFFAADVELGLLDGGLALVAAPHVDGLIDLAPAEASAQHIAVPGSQLLGGQEDLVGDWRQPKNMDDLISRLKKHGFGE